MRIARLACLLIGPLLVMTSVSPRLGYAQNQGLQINGAIYGQEGKGKDVTKRVQAMVQNGTVDVKVTNITMGGDPNKGTDKTLKVVYTYRGRRLNKVVKEGDRLQLP